MPINRTTTLRVGQPVVTLINVFEVSPEKQVDLIRLLDRATSEVMKRQPGFVSANIHRSLDGTRVANYAQWQSREHFERMLRDPDAQAHMKATSELARATPALYELVSVHSAQQADH